MLIWILRTSSLISITLASDWESGLPRVCLTLLRLDKRVVVPWEVSQQCPLLTRLTWLIFTNAVMGMQMGLGADVFLSNSHVCTAAASTPSHGTWRNCSEVPHKLCSSCSTRVVSTWRLHRWWDHFSSLLCIPHTFLWGTPFSESVWHPYVSHAFPFPHVTWVLGS